MACLSNISLSRWKRHSNRKKRMGRLRQNIQGTSARKTPATLELLRESDAFTNRRSSTPIHELRSPNYMTERMHSWRPIYLTIVLCPNSGKNSTSRSNSYKMVLINGPKHTTMNDHKVESTATDKLPCEPSMTQRNLLRKTARQTRTTCCVR